MILTNLAGPFWAALADRGTLEKKTILIVGCLGEGISATCFAFVPNFTMMMVVRAFSGFFLAALRPICNGIVADLTSENRRGKVFGRVQGALLCGMFVSDLIADTCFIMLYLAFAESDLFFLCELYPAKVGSFFSSVTSTLRGKHGESVLLAGRRQSVPPRLALPVRSSRCAVDDPGSSSEILPVGTPIRPGDPGHPQ